MLGWTDDDGYRRGFSISAPISTPSTPPSLMVTPFGVFPAHRPVIYTTSPSPVMFHCPPKRVIISSSSDELKDKPIIIGGRIVRYVRVPKKAVPVYDRDGDLIDYKY